MKSKIYIETSVISYFTGGETRDILITARQQITKKWWINNLVNYDPHISGYVFEEISKGDQIFAARRIEAVKEFKTIEPSDEINKLAQEFNKRLQVPEKAFFDCLHIATAVLNGIDILVSWNFKHIVNPMVRETLKSTCLELGYIEPQISSPEELLGE
jgi:predicted nucleic acid-binding protein